MISRNVKPKWSSCFKAKELPIKNSRIFWTRCCCLLRIFPSVATSLTVFLSIGSRLSESRLIPNYYNLDTLITTNVKKSALEVLEGWVYFLACFKVLILMGLVTFLSLSGSFELFWSISVFRTRFFGLHRIFIVSFLLWCFETSEDTEKLENGFADRSEPVEFRHLGQDRVRGDAAVLAPLLVGRRLHLRDASSWV